MATFSLGKGEVVSSILAGSKAMTTILRDHDLVRAEGLEPSRDCSQGILSAIAASAIV